MEPSAHSMAHHTFRRLVGRSMAREGVFIFVLTILLLLIACEQQKKDEYKIIEYVKVEGVCFEDHVNQPDNYSGRIVHWYNVTQNVHGRYGSVHQPTIDTKKIHERVKERVENPYKYHPPFMITFRDLTQEEITGNQLHLKGISNSPAEPGESSYASTCVLSVVERLDHLPEEP